MSENETKEGSAPAGPEPLIARCRKGDLGAFDELLKSQEKRIFRIVYHMLGNVEDSRDVCQEVFIRIYRYIHKFKDEKRFSIWIYRLAVNASIDFIKQRASQKGMVSAGGLPESYEAAASDPNQEQAYLAQELQQRVLANLGKLTPAERAAFILRDLHGLEVKEIAKIQGINRITVRRHLGRARARLKELLSKGTG